MPIFKTLAMKITGLLCEEKTALGPTAISCKQTLHYQIKLCKKLLKLTQKNEFFFTTIKTERHRDVVYARASAAQVNGYPNK